MGKALPPVTFSNSVAFALADTCYTLSSKSKHWACQAWTREDFSWSPHGHFWWLCGKHFGLNFILEASVISTVILGFQKKIRL
jgi:hypothetical protein